MVLMAKQEPITVITAVPERVRRTRFSLRAFRLSTPTPTAVSHDVTSHCCHVAPDSRRLIRAHPVDITAAHLGYPRCPSPCACCPWGRRSTTSSRSCSLVTRNRPMLSRILLARLGDGFTSALVGKESSADLSSGDTVGAHSISCFVHFLESPLSAFQ